jgi:hypothetical protein
MSNEICATCKPTTSTAATPSKKVDACKAEYKILDECMKTKNGNISSCRNEWKGFRQCFNAKAEKPVDT